MPDESPHAAATGNPGSGPQGETAEDYIIAPRDARNEAQIEKLRRCREAIEQAPASQVSESRSFLKARMTPSLAHQIQQNFGDHLVIEKDKPLPDPRLMPDVKV